VPWAPDERSPLIVFDSCDLFDADQQQAAFALFVDRHRAVFPSLRPKRPARDLPLRDDLGPAWAGARAVLQPLSESRRALPCAARRPARLFLRRRDGLPAHRFARDLKYLMTLLDSLDDTRSSTSAHHGAAAQADARIARAGMNLCLFDLTTR